MIGAWRPDVRGTCKTINLCQKRVLQITVWIIAPLLAELTTATAVEPTGAPSGRVRLTSCEEAKFSGAFRLSADMACGGSIEVRGQQDTEVSPGRGLAGHNAIEHGKVLARRLVVAAPCAARVIRP